MCNVTCIINKIYHEMWHLVFIILYEQTGYEVEIELKTPLAYPKGYGLEGLIK